MVKKHKLWIRYLDGSLRESKPTDTLWLKIYVQNPPSSIHIRKLFWQRFCLTYDSFLSLLSDLKAHIFFSWWSNEDIYGYPPSYIALLLLGSLRYIGWYFTFDNIEETNGISRELNQSVFHIFILYGSIVLYNLNVLIPATTTNSSIFEEIFQSDGFNGWVGSTDATHIEMSRCAVWLHITI